MKSGALSLMANTYSNVYLMHNPLRMSGHFIRPNNVLLKLSLNSWFPCFSVGK